MRENSVVICGLPDSGKTTFLAALWHLITARDVQTILRFGSLRHGEVGYLNAIAAKWRNAKQQRRTPIGGQLVSMNFLDSTSTSLRITFPDLSGEVYRRIWEERYCDEHVAALLENADGIVLFLHADKIRSPQWIVDFNALAQQLGLQPRTGNSIPWHPRYAPTQVQLVDLLQMFCSKPLTTSTRNLSIVMSAWDKVEAEGLRPGQFLASKLPLLEQYLSSNSGRWKWRVYGVSAQGGDYEKEVEPGQPEPPPLPEAEALRAKDKASERIRLLTDNGESHDLTEPLAWLIG